MDDAHREILEELTTEPMEVTRLAQLLDMDLSVLEGHLKFLSRPLDPLIEITSFGDLARAHLLKRGELRLQALQAPDPSHRS